MQPHSDWDDLDFELFEAFDLLERETSQAHGLPRWLSTTADSSVGFEVDTYTDWADAALDEWDEKHQGKKRKPGVTRFAIPKSLTGEDIEGGLARERLLQAQADLEEADLVDEYGLDIDRKARGGEYDPADYG